MESSASKPSNRLRKNHLSQRQFFPLLSPSASSDSQAYLSVLVPALDVRVEQARRGRGPTEVRGRQPVRFGLQLQLLDAQQEPAILMLELFVPELALLHARQLVLQELYVLDRGLEDRALVRPHVTDYLVVAATIILRIYFLHMEIA